MNIDSKNLIRYAEQLLQEAKTYNSVCGKQDYTSDCLKQGTARNLRAIAKQLIIIARKIQPK